MVSIVKPCRQQSRFLPAFTLMLLAETPMHGGALREALGARVPEMRADSAAVYRALTALEKTGELRSKWHTKGGGPAIRTYELTAAGWQRLKLWQDDVRCRVQNLQYFLDTCAKLTKPRGLK
jgi:PadR family transcriptional regulator, regulatory protein PadR